jgi:hypothetical protein
MALFSRSEKTAWFGEANDFCRANGINIMAWGPDLLTVEAKSEERAKEIAAQLAQLGFTALPNEDDAYAGMLDLSRNPAAIRSKIASFDVSRRPLSEQIEPFVWALGCLLLVPGLDSQPGRYWIYFPFGVAALLLFLWDAKRIWGWRLEIASDGLRVRRDFRWATIPWDQIRAIDTSEAGRTQERVVVKLTSHASESLGTFLDSFARSLKDRLRYELAHRRPNL